MGTMTTIRRPDGDGLWLMVGQCAAVSSFTSVTTRHSRRRSRWGVFAANTAAPNPRLQRTRSAPLRSPLSRKPLGVTWLKS